MSAAPDVQKLESVKAHRRETWLWLILPTVAIGVAVILFVLALVMPFSPIRLREQVQLSIISNWMMMCFVLCPVVLCLFPIYVLLAAATIGLNRVHGMTAKGMRKVQTTTRDVADKTAKAADNLNRKSIGFNTRFAFLDALLNLFNRRKRRESEQSDGATKSK